MSFRSIRFARRILDQIASFDESEWIEIRRLCEIIRIDPAIDGVHKTVLPRPPIIFTVYASGLFWIVYSVTNATVIIENIGRAHDVPPNAW